MSPADAPKVQALVIVIDDPEPHPGCDISTIEDALMEVADEQGLGKWLSHNISFDKPRFEILFGSPDAERLFAAVEGILREYPLTRRALIEIWHDGQPSPVRAFRL